MADLITLDDLDLALNLNGDTSHEDELAVYIAAVTAHVANEYGDLPDGTYTEIVNVTAAETDGVVRLMPARQPITAVTSITDGDGTAYTTGLTITADGRIEHDDLTLGRWIVVYTSGYDAVPADLKLAALEDVRGLFQPGQIGPPAAFGAFGIDSTDTGTTYRPVRMWPRVDAWIENHSLPGIA